MIFFIIIVESKELMEKDNENNYEDNIKEGEPASSYIRRVKDVDAAKYVNQEQVTEEAWHYINKGVWKEKVRDVTKKEESSKKKKRRSKKDE